MNVLVTGSEGYIGSVLCERLQQLKFDVVGLDTDYYCGCDFKKHTGPRRIIKKDIRKISRSDVEGIDAIIHLAALSNDPMGDLNPQLTRDINCNASVALAQLAKTVNVKRFIFSSSCSMYGLAGEGAVNEESPLMPLTEYARSKVETEKIIARMADENFSPVFLRNATVYGVSERLRVDLVVNNLTAWAFTTGKIKIMSDGSPWRPLIHIRDICDAFIAVLTADKELIHSQAFNVGKNSENYQVRDIAALIKKKLPGCSIEFTGEHGSDSRSYKVDFTKIEQTLGNLFKPGRNVEQGIDELISKFKKNNFTYDDFMSERFTRLKRIKHLLESKEVDEHLYWRKP